MPTAPKKTIRKAGKRKVAKRLSFGTREVVVCFIAGMLFGMLIDQWSVDYRNPRHSAIAVTRGSSGESVTLPKQIWPPLPQYREDVTKRM